MITRFLNYIGAGAVLALCFSQAASAQDLTEQQAIEATLNNYLNGSSYNRPTQITSAFYPESDMFLHHDEKPIYRMGPDTYAALFEKRERDVFNGRYGKILDIDVAGKIATAKAEILMPRIEARFFDVFILKKLEGEWKIISKAADRTESTRNGERFLLIADEKGQKFSDVITAYEQAVRQGYTVNIAGDGSEPLTLKKIRMSNPDHKRYLYDADFMFTLENPIPLGDIKAEDYAVARTLNTKPNEKAKRLYAEICKGKTSCGD